MPGKKSSMGDPKHGEDQATLQAVSSSASLSSSGQSSMAPGSAGGSLVGGRYEIQGLLGSGGMGSVYRARDVELDEVVALKMLRRDLIDAPGVLERFRREVKLARRVTHVNVARTFDIGEHDGEKFLTMEFIDGESLATLLASSKPLPLSRVTEIAGSVCAGMAAAHAAGVVHRDLKPDNVMIESTGRVVITDFGVARSHAEGIEANKTLGGIVGTPAYMAPEQVEGAQTDHRTDIYALGVMLFELLTGELPWRAGSVISMAAARLHAPAPDPRTRKAELPASIAELVMRCMARSSKDRWASADDVAQALGALAPTVALLSNRVGVPRSAPAAADSSGVRPGPWTPTTSAETGAGEKTVAVLPFRNQGPSDDEYIADGLTEDLIDTLSMTRGLKVRPRGIVAVYKGRDSDPREIGHELGVQVVVEGSVRRAGETVRINARVISIADGFQLWAKRFDRNAADLLVVSDEVAHAIAEALAVDVQAKPREAPSDPAAVEYYLRGRQEFRRMWPEATRRAVQLFREAEARAPGDPTILSAYARACARMRFFSPDPSAEITGFARALAERACAAAPDRGEPLVALAQVRYTEGDVAASARLLRSALVKAPLLADAHELLAEILAETGTLEDALARYETALSLDTTLRSRFNLARVKALLGQWDDVERLLEVPPEDPESRIMGGVLGARLALWSPNPLAAIAKLGYLNALPPVDPVLYARTVVDVIQKGQIEDSHRTFMRSALVPEGQAPRLVMLKAQLGTELMSYALEIDEALSLVTRGVEAGLLDLNWMKFCPLLGPLRADLRFQTAQSVVDQRARVVREALR